MLKTYASFLRVQVSEHHDVCAEERDLRGFVTAAWIPGKDVHRQLMPDVTQD